MAEIVKDLGRTRLFFHQVGEEGSSPIIDVHVPLVGQYVQVERKVLEEAGVDTGESIYTFWGRLTLNEFREAQLDDFCPGFAPIDKNNSISI